MDQAHLSSHFSDALAGLLHISHMLVELITLDCLVGLMALLLACLSICLVSFLHMQDVDC